MNLLRLKSKLLIALIGVFFAFNPLSLAAQALNYKGPFKSIKRIMPRLYEVSDANGNIFILKVHFSIESALCEIIAAEIGKNIINISEIQLLPNTICIDGESLEFQHNQIFTLHTFIDGESFFEAPILQAIINEKNLNYITKTDPSFVQIVAFNLFVYNRYCLSDSLLKNKKTNLFYLIDMNYNFEYYKNEYENPTSINYNFESYKKEYENPASMMQQYLKTIKKESLSLENIEALKKFNETLNHLINLYPLEKLHNLCVEKAVELQESSYDITDLSFDMKNFLNFNETNVAITNHFNEIKKIHAHINYLTAANNIV